MYAHTGFSRAKISVYLKNLMELELVEKVLPGTYEICNAFVRFYFVSVSASDVWSGQKAVHFMKNTSGKNIMIFNC